MDTFSANTHFKTVTITDSATGSSKACALDQGKYIKTIDDKNFDCNNCHFTCKKCSDGAPNHCLTCQDKFTKIGEVCSYNFPDISAEGLLQIDISGINMDQTYFDSYFITAMV